MNIPNPYGESSSKENGVIARLHSQVPPGYTPSCGKMSIGAEESLKGSEQTLIFFFTANNI